MTNKQKASEVDPRLEQTKRRCTATRTKKVGAFAMAAAIGLVVVACTPGTQEAKNAAMPAETPAAT